MSESIAKKVFISFKQLFVGTGLKTLLSIISGYLYALLLGPAVFGVWQTARIIMSYASFINLGMPFYIQREYPALVKENKTDEAKKLAQLVISFTFISFPFIAFILCIVAIFFTDNFNFSKSILTIAIWFVVIIPSGVGTILNKMVNDYKTVGIGESLFGLGSVLIVPLIYYYGFNALLFGFLITSLVQSWYYFKNRPIKYHWFWDSKLLKVMIFTAFPLFLVHIAAAVFASVDRIIIAGMLNFKDVGLYSLSTFIASPISLVVTSFSVVLFTHLNEKFGRSREPNVIEKHVFIPQRIFSNLLPPFIGMGIVALPLLTEVFLPKYREGISAAQINVFAVFFYMLAGFSANALYVLGKQKLSALSFLIAGLIKIAGSIMSILLGFGIVGVAFFSLLGYFVYDSMMLFFVSRSLKFHYGEYFKRLIDKLFCPFMILLTSAFYVIYHKNIFTYFNFRNSWIQLLFGELFIILVGLPFIITAMRSINLFLKKKAI